MRLASAFAYTFILLISPLILCVLTISLPLTRGRSLPALTRWLEGRF
jgi:hypothetical protein